VKRKDKRFEDKGLRFQQEQGPEPRLKPRPKLKPAPEPVPEEESMVKVRMRPGRGVTGLGPGQEGYLPEHVANWLLTIGYADLVDELPVDFTP